MPGQRSVNDIGALPLPTEVVLPDKMSLGTSKWNTSNLSSRLGADATSAASASVLVAPIICVIDRYADVDHKRDVTDWRTDRSSRKQRRAIH